MDCLKLGKKFKLIKDSDFSPLDQIHSYLDPNPITTLKRPLDMCIYALNFYWLVEKKQALESKISRELRDRTLNTWAIRVHTLPVRVRCSILCSRLSWAIFFCKSICTSFLWFELVKSSSYLFLKDLFSFNQVGRNILYVVGFI